MGIKPARLFCVCVMAEPWTRSGLVKGIGIPAPSGGRSVGCVDLMHKFEGDDHGGLLVRLFYPAQLNPSQPPGTPSTYAPWNPHKRYVKAYLEFQKTWGPGLIASITNTFLNPRIPAVMEAALLGTYLQCGPEVNEPEQSGTEVNVESESSTYSRRGIHDKPLSFPVVVFSHGLGGMRTTYSGICCDLASHGYVVAAIEHRDRSACASFQRVRVADPVPSQERTQFRDEWIEFYHRLESEKEFPLRNKQVLQRSREAILALDLLTKLNEGVDVANMMEGTFNFEQFKGRLDVSKPVIMGHSFGGATTVQALSEDPRFICGIALDCWMIPIHRDLLESGIHQPLLFINSFSFQWPDNVRRMMKLTHPPQYIGASACTILTLKGTLHTNQSDVPFISPKFAQKLTNSLSPLDPIIAHKLNLDICHAFFKRYLLRDPAFLQRVPNLDGGEGCSEHIIFGSNIDLSGPSEDGSTQTAKQADPSTNGTQGDDSVTRSSEDKETAKKNADLLVDEFMESGSRPEERREGNGSAHTIKAEQSAKL